MIIFYGGQKLNLGNMLLFCVISLISSHDMQTGLVFLSELYELARDLYTVNILLLIHFPAEPLFYCHRLMANPQLV